MIPDTVYEFEIDLWNTSHVFLEGHAIRLEVSSSAFPKYDANLNTLEPIETSTTGRVARNSVWHGAGYPSRVVLPEISAAAPVVPSPPRETA
jgi:predicted acyl esterase